MPAEVSHARFFRVSVLKLVVLSLCTGGLYELYWFFKNWQLESERRGGGRYLAPAVHVVFAYFLCYRLFRSVARLADEVGVRKASSGLLAISWVALHLAQRLPSRLWVISAASVVPLAIVQGTVNQICDKTASEDPRNNRFSAANVATCAVGVFVVLFALVDTFAPALLPK
jgi:hypothetical protein